MLSCKKYLNCPFIFTSCDTLVKNKIHPPKLNWIGVDKVEDPEDYLIVHKYKNELINLVDKKKKTYFRKQLKDFSKKFDAFIGLAGIKDYKIFWKNLSQDNKLIKKEYQVSNGLKGLIKKKIQLKKFQWLDTGDQKNYLNAKKSLEKIKT